MLRFCVYAIQFARHRELKSQYIVILLLKFPRSYVSLPKIAIYCDSGNMNSKEIGHNIKQRRRQLNVPQATVAALAGISVNTLVAIERGEGNPRIDNILSVLDTLGLRFSIALKE